MKIYYYPGLDTLVYEDNEGIMWLPLVDTDPDGVWFKSAWNKKKDAPKDMQFEYLGTI